MSFTFDVFADPPYLDVTGTVYSGEIFFDLTVLLTLVILFLDYKVLLFGG